MSFERPTFQNPERVFERQEEEEIKEKKLRSVIEGIAERLMSQEVPVTGDCRIDMGAFKEVYPESEIQRDQELVRGYEREWYGGVSEEEVQEKRSKSAGEKLERLKTAIFDKFLGADFIVVRTSSYDDIKNKVDNVILERETGNLVCAFDEVGDLSGARFEKKKLEVLERNKREKGGSLKYGMRLTQEGELVLGEVRHLPIFYLALPKEHIERGIEHLSDSREAIPFEKKLFDYFRSSLEAQADSLELERNLNPELRERLLHFEEALHRYHPSRNKQD